MVRGFWQSACFAPALVRKQARRSPPDMPRPPSGREPCVRSAPVGSSIQVPPPIPSMRALSLLIAPLCTAAVLGTPVSTLHAQSGPLRIVRVTPTADAGPLQQISVTFDRPVAGSLDRSIDPTTILRVEPAVRGRLEWRDPVTIRLTPNAPLAPGARYTVTVANTFHAMDGSALAEPYTFTFRAHGPLLLTGSPVAGAGQALHVTPTQRFALVYSAPVDLPMLSGTAYVELSATCGGQRV